MTTTPTAATTTPTSTPATTITTTPTSTIATTATTAIDYRQSIPTVAISNTTESSLLYKSTISLTKPTTINIEAHAGLPFTNITPTPPFVTIRPTFTTTYTPIMTTTFPTSDSFLPDSKTIYNNSTTPLTFYNQTSIIPLVTTTIATTTTDSTHNNTHPLQALMTTVGHLLSRMVPHLARSQTSLSTVAPPTAGRGRVINVS